MVLQKKTILAQSTKYFENANRIVELKLKDRER